jgi:hypothetical protein
MKAGGCAAAFNPGTAGTLCQVATSFGEGLEIVASFKIASEPVGFYPRKENVVRKSLFLTTSAALICLSALPISAVGRDRSDRSGPTANQIVNQSDALTARMKMDLRLTPEQEKNWPGFEGAMQDMGKKKADRMIARRDERSNEKTPFNVLEQITRRADSQIERSNDWKKLADAAKPLYASLDEQQKRRFAERLLDDDRERERDSN